ncbi:YkgJ family cysteine cluster protein [Sorangium sp. So ce296]|uniref:YkgJ family cysteine cluster protein n=1 Tax=Sorangium sp. So ce296 TaxID=3133296 RepID=UPI003F5D702A
MGVASGWRASGEGPCASRAQGDPPRLGGAQRWREQTPCFFLNAGTAQCSIYPVRPLVCRLHNSVDRDQCQRASEDATQNTPVPRHAAFEILYGLAQSAIIVACLEAGLDARSLELTTAVDVALRGPDASARWACGEKLFEPAATRSEPAPASPAAPRAVRPGLVPSERLVANTSNVARNARKRERRARGTARDSPCGRQLLRAVLRPRRVRRPAPRGFVHAGAAPRRAPPGLTPRRRRSSTWVGRLNLGRSPQPGSVASTWVGRLNLGRSSPPQPGSGASASSLGP